MLPPRIPREVRRPPKALRLGDDPNYRKLIPQIGRCLGCGRWMLPNLIQCHHLLRSGEHGMGKRSSDRWGLPLCQPCHAALHGYGNEDEWFANRNIDARAVAATLWSYRGDLEGMIRCVNRAWEAARLKETP